VPTFANNLNKQPKLARVDIRIPAPQVPSLWSEALRNRWVILALLFAVRLTMAFQFQSVAAVAPLLGRDFGVGIADIGLLIGLYFTPGIALSLPGGAIGQRFGDKKTVLGALALMLIGSLVMADANSWSWQIAGRLVAGAGGVLLNVQLTKMIADWFAGKEIASAMGIFVNSWPAGIALSLVTLPFVGTAFGVSAVYLAVSAGIAIALVLATAYQPPPNTVTSRAASATAASARPDVNTLLAVIAAGSIWGLFNVGFATIFSFGPTLLVERGWSIASAGSTISIGLWLAVVSIPLGGFVADRLKRPQSIIVLGCIIFAILMIALPRTNLVICTIVALGLISGQPAGPMMSLPARVLAPPTRAIGMGVFYTVYYAAMMLGPVVAGALAKWSGSAAAAFDFGAAVVLACPLLLWVFNRIATARPPFA
jgi:predicted MFS family arabinose efflux permease